MIELPDFTEQAMYDFETYFHLSMSLDRMAKFAAHYEAFKMVLDVPGSIVECGVFKGTSFSRFALFRQLLGNPFTAALVAFDVFDDAYPDTAFEEDRAQREHWITSAGGSSISTAQLAEALERRNIGNFRLVQGDVLQTIPQFIEENPGFKISLLNVDIDFVEPTLCVLEHFFDRVCRGGIVLLDNYAGEGTSGISLHGDTKAVDQFFQDRDVQIRRFPFGARPCYILKS